MTGLELAQARAFTAVPMHGLNGCVMGFYFGMFAFGGDKKFLGYALVVPYIFHGTYNFLIGLEFIYGLGILIILVVTAFNLHKRLKHLQKDKILEDEEKKYS